LNLHTLRDSVLKRINLYGSYSNAKSNTNLSLTNTKQLDTKSLIKDKPNNHPNLEINGLSHTFLFGSDLFISPKQTISLETNIIHSPFNQNHTLQTYNNLFDTNETHESYVSENHIYDSNQEFYSLLSYRNDFSDKNRMELDYAYNISKSELQNSYFELPDIETTQNLPSNQNTSVLDFNLKHQFNPTYSFEIGYKNALRKYDYEYTSVSHHIETETNKDIRHLLYTYLSYSPDKKVKMKIGLAAEKNTLKSNGQTQDNHSYQPFLNVFYNHSKDLNITLKINSDSEYPYANQINPFVITTDRITREKGNPNLNYSTKYTNAVDFKLFKNKLSIEPFYRYTKNHISRTGQAMSDHFVYTYSNLDRYESYGVRMSTKITLMPKKMFFSLTGAVYTDETEFKAHTNRLTDFTINSNIIYISSKHKTLYALMLKKMNAKTIEAYGHNNTNNDYLGYLIKQPFFKNKMAVTLVYILPVSSGLSYTMEDYFSYHNFTEKSITNVEILKNLLMVNITVNINKGKEVKTIEKKNYKDKKVTKGLF